MSVRAKFRLVSQTMTADTSAEGAASLKFQAAQGATNKSWSKWTPSGELTMYVTNPEALAQLELGKFYFLDFSEAPATEAEEAK